MVHKWSLPRPGPYLVPIWSSQDLSGPNIVPMSSLWTPIEVPTWSHLVPTCSIWSLQSPYLVLVCLVPAWSLFGPYLVLTWNLYGPHLALFKNFDEIDSKGGSAHAVMYDRKVFCRQLGEKLFF